MKHIGLKTRFTFLVLLFSVILGVWSFFIEPGLLVQRDLGVMNWPGPSFKIAFLSDLHAGAPHIDEAYIQNLVERVNALSPDLILLGGDFVINGVVGGKPMPMEKVILHIQKFRASKGVYAVLGNHDWWNDGNHIRKIFETNGIPVLENSAERIQVNDDFHFWLVGIGDHFTKHADPALAVSNITTDAPRILFMHDPAALFELNEKFLLALAGHLHGGQVYVPGIGAVITPGKAPREWADGWVDFKLGSLFVSKGVGTSIFPVRFNAPPEFVLLELKQK